MKKRIAALLLALALCVGLLPMAALADDAADENVTLLTQENFTSYLETEGYYRVLKEGSYKLVENIELAEQDGFCITGTVILDLNGFVLKYLGGFWSYEPITIVDGNLTLNDSAPKTAHHFKVLENGIWELDEENGTETIYGGIFTRTSSGNSELAGVVFMQGKQGGTFVMNGGNIVGCQQRGARDCGVVTTYKRVDTFTMNGGSIVGCIGDSGDAVSNNGTFTMNGGIIRGRTVSGSANKVIYNKSGAMMYANGGEVYGKVENFGTITNESTAKSTTVFYNQLSGNEATGNIVTFYSKDMMNYDIWYAWEVVRDGGHVVRPAEPAGGEQGYQVVWAEKEKEPWNFANDTVTKNTDLYIHDWELCTYTITWEADGGELDGEETSKTYGSTLVQPTVSKDGCTFVGWYKDEALTEPWDFETDTVTENLTLYAKWEEDEQPSIDYKWLIAGGLAGASELTNPTFVDVSRGAYYYNAVDWAQNKGVAGGVDSKHFAPDESCTRAQAVTMLWRAAGCPDVWGDNPFVDVDVSDYYYEAVLWAVTMGITSGTDENHFSPDEPCTRGQIVTFLHREARCYQAHENYGFTDVKTGSYCEDAVNWAVSCGITNGTSEATFSPDAVCTRAQIVTFLYRNR